MTPKRMYDVIFWAVTVGLVMVPVALQFLEFLSLQVSIPPLAYVIPTALAYGAVALACVRLGQGRRMFLVSAGAAGLFIALMLGVRKLLEDPLMAYVVKYAGWGLVAVWGWTLLSAVAAECESHQQMDVARAARMRRFLFLFFMVVRIVIVYLPVVGNWKIQITLMNFVPLAANAAGDLLVALTVQSARRRLYPE